MNINGKVIAEEPIQILTPRQVGEATNGEAIDANSFGSLFVFIQSLNSISGDNVSVVGIIQESANQSDWTTIASFDVLNYPGEADAEVDIQAIAVARTQRYLRYVSSALNGTSYPPHIADVVGIPVTERLLPPRIIIPEGMTAYHV